MPAWIKAGNPVTADLRKPSKGSLEVKTRELVAKQAELVDAVLNNKPIAIIDARASKYYSGADKGSMPRAGRIPNAQNIPYTSFVDSDNMFKSLSELEKLFSKAGVKKENPVVTYCHIGQQASLAYFAARMLGYKVRIYDGSFQEWSNSKEEIASDPDR
jgi:thiosulfate/3-mercaptopyruvate sulfurtransferase